MYSCHATVEQIDRTIIYVLQIALDRFSNLLDFIANKKKGYLAN